MIRHHHIWLLISLLLIPCATGCTSPWEKNFDPNPEVSDRALPQAGSVQIRVVPFERLQQYTNNEHALRVHSTTAPEEMPPEEKLAAKNRLLEALQLPQRGDEILVLGWSEFGDTDKLDPKDKRLEEFARKIGADVVVLSSQYAGKVTQTIDRPMTTYSSGYVTAPPGYRGRGRRGYGSTSYSESSTTWVPTNVISDQFLYTAVFLRRNDDLK